MRAYGKLLNSITDRELISFTVDVYLDNMTSVINRDTFMAEVTGFCGCEIIRRYLYCN